MRKLFLFLFLCVLGTLSVWADDVVYLTTEQFRERVFDYKNNRDWKYEGDKPCVIDFYTVWCGPCKRLAPIMEELSQKYCDQVIFYKADTERERELAYVFGINSIPQVLYVPVKGKPALLKGLYPKEEIIRIIEDYLLAAPEEPIVEEVKEEPKVEKEQPKSLWQRWKEKMQNRKNKK